MRKFNYFSLGMLAAAATFSACSSSDDVAGDNPGVENATRAFINVNIVNNSTRALGADNFENGNTELGENNVSNARFYFFDASGNAYPVDGNKNFVSPDITPESVTNIDVTNVNGNETNPTGLEVSIEIQGSTYPDRMVAVLNVPSGSEWDNVDNISLSNLKNKLISTGLTKATKTKDNTFVMSNSAYVSNSAVVDAVALTTSNFSATASESATPVNVFVERVVGKVTASISNNNYDATNQRFELSSSNYDAIQNYSDKIYAKILGWNITSTAQKGNTVKDISASWTDAGLNFGTNEPWNSADYHRSFWATTPSELTYGYNNNTTAAGNKALAATTANANYFYCFENTGTFSGSDYSNSNATKVIVYAQLVKLNNGQEEALDIVRWKGVNYLLDDFKTIVLAAAKEKGIKYESSSDTYSDLTKEMIDLRYDRSTLNSHVKAYKGIPTIAETSKEQYKFQIGTDKEKSLADVEKELSDYICNYYENGMTYYYIDIDHLNGEPAIVRNHVYKVTITDIQGLGTPIVTYDPNDPNKPDNTPDPDGPGNQPEIIPEKPADTNAYIKAKINVLSWRIVDNGNVTLK